MKKTIGIPLLLLANIIILAHAIVPHHHHNGIVFSICIFLSDNEDLEYNHAHSQPCTHYYCHNSENHEHDEVFSDNCLLNDLYLPTNNDKQLLSSDDTDVINYSDYFLLFDVVPNQIIEIQDYGNLPFRQKPYLTSSYDYYVTHSLGMRAPPVC